MKTASSIMLRVLIGLIVLTGIYIFLIFAIAFAALYTVTDNVVRIKHLNLRKLLFSPKLVTTATSHVANKRNYR